MSSAGSSPAYARAATARAWARVTPAAATSTPSPTAPPASDGRAAERQRAPALDQAQLGGRHRDVPVVAQQPDQRGQAGRERDLDGEERDRPAARGQGEGQAEGDRGHGGDPAGTRDGAGGELV